MPLASNAVLPRFKCLFSLGCTTKICPEVSVLLLVGFAFWLSRSNKKFLFRLKPNSGNRKGGFWRKSGGTNASASTRQGDDKVFDEIYMQNPRSVLLARSFEGTFSASQGNKKKKRKKKAALQTSTSFFSPPGTAAQLFWPRSAFASPSRPSLSAAAAQQPCPAEPRGAPLPALTGAGSARSAGRGIPSSTGARQDRHKVFPAGLRLESPALSEPVRRGAQAAPSPQGPGCPHRARRRGQVEALPPSPRTVLPALLRGKGVACEPPPAESTPTHRHGPAGSPG